MYDTSNMWIALAPLTLLIFYTSSVTFDMTYYKMQGTLNGLNLELSKYSKMSYSLFTLVFSSILIYSLNAFFLIASFIMAIFSKHSGTSIDGKLPCFKININGWVWIILDGEMCVIANPPLLIHIL